MKHAQAQSSLQLSDHAMQHTQLRHAFYNQTVDRVANQPVVADLDNPLIDRDLSMPRHLVSQIAVPKAAPVYYRQYELPDFYQPAATERISATSSIAADTARDAKIHTALPTTVRPMPPATPSNPLAQPPILSQADIEHALANPKIHINLLKQSHSLVENRAAVQDSLSELVQDLATSILPEDGKDYTAYQNAVSAWQAQADDLHDPQTYAAISDYAVQGLPDALLRQALVIFRGNARLGIKADAQQAFALIEAAAKQGDIRAAKALSKLYFAGDGVTPDMAQGRFWLTQAADDGHKGAQAVLASMAAADGLKQTQQADDQYLQRLAIATAVLVTIALVVIVFVKV